MSITSINYRVVASPPINLQRKRVSLVSPRISDLCSAIRVDLLCSVLTQLSAAAKTVAVLGISISAGCFQRMVRETHPRLKFRRQDSNPEDTNNVGSYQEYRNQPRVPYRFSSGIDISSVTLSFYLNSSSLFITSPFRFLLLPPDVRIP